jgi:hypothetical protein
MMEACSHHRKCSSRAYLRKRTRDAADVTVRAGVAAQALHVVVGSSCGASRKRKRGGIMPAVPSSSSRKTPDASSPPAPSKRAAVASPAATQRLKKRKKRPVLINGKPLGALRDVVAAQYPSLRHVRVNPAVKRGAPQYKRFSAAVASAGESCRIDYLLHGTPENNIDSILATALRGSPELGNRRWFTSCPNIASTYAGNARRIVICAVLHPTPCQKAYPTGAFTSDVDAHHLPLFVARRF